MIKQEISTTSSVQYDTEAHTDEKQLKDNQKTNSKQKSKQNQKVFKNAAIMGLVNANMLPLEDVLWSDSENGENADLTNNVSETS